MSRSLLRKIYWRVLAFLPKKAVLKLNLALRCLLEEWDFAVNIYPFSSDFADLENEEIRQRLNGANDQSIAIAEEYVKRCRNLEKIKGFPFSDGSCTLVRLKTLKNDIMCYPEQPECLPVWQKKYGFKTGAEVLIYQHGLSFLRELVSPYLKGKVFIDAGACIGELIPALLEYYPEKIYAFEPSEKNVRRFQKEMKKKGISSENAVVIPAALGEEADWINFNDLGGCGQNIFIGDGASQCEVTTLDNFAAAHNLNRIGLIKSDVEGMGLALCKGAVNIIKRDRPVLVLAAYHNREELLGQYEFLSRKLENYHFELRDLPSGSCFELSWLGVPGEIWNKNDV